MRSKFILAAMLGVALLFAAFTPAPAQPLAPAVQAADVLTAVSVLGGTEGVTAASPALDFGFGGFLVAGFKQVVPLPDLVSSLSALCTANVPGAELRRWPGTFTISEHTFPGVYFDCRVPGASATPSTTPRTEHAPMSLHIKQGKAETPLALKGQGNETVQDLVDRAVANLEAQERLKASIADKQQVLADEQQEILADFEKLRERIEKTHSLQQTYSVLGEGGGFRVTLGASFKLHEKFTDAWVLKNALEQAGAPELITLFRIDPKPDQKLVKNHGGSKALMKVGAITPDAPKVAMVTA